MRFSAFYEMPRGPLAALGAGVFCVLRVAPLADRHVVLGGGNALVGGADDALGGAELLDAVRAPTRRAGDGKQRGIHAHGDAEHPVNEARVKVDVGAHRAGAAFELTEYGGREALDGFKQIKVLAVSFLIGQIARVAFEHHGAGVGKGVDGVPHAVDEAAVVVGLAAQDFGEKRGNFLVVARVVHVLLDAVKHFLRLDIGAAVAGAFQRADGRGDGGIGVGTRGGEHAAGKRRVVAAAVFGVDDQSEVEQFGFLVGVGLVGAEHAQKVFRGGEFLFGVVDVQTVPAEHVAVHGIGVRRDHGQARHQLHPLPQHIGKGGFVGVVVVGVERQHTRGHLVHDRGRGRLHQDILVKARGQAAVTAEQARKAIQLRGGGQTAEKEQIAGFGKAEAPLRGKVIDKILHAVAAVVEFAVHGRAIALAHDVAVHVADAGNARHHAGAVRLAQAAFDVIVVKGRAGDHVLVLRRDDQFFQHFGVLGVIDPVLVDERHGSTSLSLKNG